MSRGVPHLVVAAGGTGGHMVPAHVLAGILRGRGWTASLITDERGLRYPGLFDGCTRHVIPSASLGGRNPLVWARSLLAILSGRRAARSLFRAHRPSAVVGFGGYPAFPALLAALSMKVPTIIHDQNAVLGRVNRLLAGRVDAIATAYRHVQRLGSDLSAKTHMVGNPVRDDIVALRHAPLPGGDVLNLLVVGGSQGATILSRVVPAAVAAMTAKVRVVQQCRPEDIEAVRAAYAAAGIEAELKTFIDDMPARLADAHVVISRSGASTVAELTVAGRPAILVPLPSAMDNHQVWNARELADAGGAVLIEQADFTAAAVAAQLDRWAGDRAALTAAATAARGFGLPDAGPALAALVAQLAGQDSGVTA